MDQNKQNITFGIDGMSCTGCETRIENSIRKMDGVIEVSASFNEASVHVIWDTDRVVLKKIIETIEQSGYGVRKTDENGVELAPKLIEREETEEKAGNGTQAEKTKHTTKKKASQMVGIGIIIAALYLVVSQMQSFGFVPEINQSMGYGILFLVGLLTSLHCVAMCGGINLSVCMQFKGSNEEKTRFGKFIPSALYNLGRVISYTVVGGLVGSLGSVISLPGRAKGIVAVLSGVFMLIMGLNMLEFFPALRKLNPRLPKFLGRNVYSQSNKRGPLIVGMLNGLMPCGPLQAMQLYALGTGSFTAGALSMFLFSIGTVPLLFGFGALSSVLKGKFTQRMMKVSSVLVIVLGLVMLNRGLNLSGFGLTTAPAGSNIASVENGVQVVSIDLDPGAYSPIIVQKGLPVQWTIKVEKGDLNGCNNPVTIPQLGIQKELTVGDNVIEFTPEKEGDMIYTCWMGMISSRIRVVPDIGSVSEEDAADIDSSGIGDVGGIALIPTDTAAVGEIRDGVQYVEIDVNENEFSPAVVVLQENIKTVWTINGAQLNDHNSRILFPAYRAGLNVQEGENVIEFTPEFGFDFQCPTGILFGVVKTVKDINDIDIPAIQSEIKEYRPNPEGSGASCH